jgi:hypothetical protein
VSLAAKAAAARVATGGAELGLRRRTDGDGSWRRRTAAHVQAGTPSRQLAEIKVAASHRPVQRRSSRTPSASTRSHALVADPLHRLADAVITDGGGAVVLVGRIARSAGASKCSVTAKRPSTPTTGG